MHTIYTIGYANLTPARLKEIAAERDALVVDIHMSAHSRRPEWCRDALRGARERAAGDYDDGRYAWEFTNIRKLSEPLPARGYQGIWETEWAPIEALLPLEIGN